jgi:predicted DNA-binding transcriptional regulator YafY
MAGPSRAERLREMERLYLLRAYSDIEMAERLSTPEHRFDRTTIFRDRGFLESEIPFVQDEDGRYRIDKTKYISSIRVDLQEALSLYLAARRASQQSRVAQKSTASALEKLAGALRQPMTERLVKAADRLLSRSIDPHREAIFETAAQAWVEGRCLRLHYQGLRGKKAYTDLFAIYLVEPSPWSDSVYLIGRSDHWNDIAVYKLDRIERANLSGEPANVPADFDEEELLRYAWGIWRSEKKPEPVQLRFAPGTATRRVKESVWHPLEKVTDTEDGGCLWQAPIAEWQEMLPWIRGWGADVEVVGPTELQNQIAREVRNLARLYGVETSIHLDKDAPDYDQQRAKQLFRK